MTWWQWLLAGYVVLTCWLIYGRGPFCLAYNPLIARGLKALKVVAMCIGARGYLVKPLAQFTVAQLLELEEHEGDHYELQRRWGPLFFPIYWWLLAIYGYDKHPWEQRARRKAGQPER